MAIAMPITSQRLPERKPRSSASVLAVAVFRNEALRGGGEPEIDRLPEQQHPGPDIDVDAELEGAHPAREQHLRAEEQRGAATRIRNTVPARRCTSMCSASSRRALSCDHEPSKRRPRRRRVLPRNPVSANARASASCGRDRRPGTAWEWRPSKEPLTFGWTAGRDLGHRLRGGMGQEAGGRN